MLPVRSGNRRKGAGDLIPFETDNNIGTIDVDANGVLHPWYGENIAKQDNNDTMPSATPNPTADMDHPPSDDSPFDDPSFKMHHGSFYPQIFYDDHHDHFDHHDHDIPMTTTTTTPEPPPKTKPMYAHYGLRLKFWYAHLAFAFWFIMYMIWLMMKSLGRHGTRLPNHTSLRKREIRDPLEEKQEETDLIYSYVMNQLSSFKKKYQV